MPSSLSDSQLKAALTNDQIVAARTKSLGEGETIDVVAEEIATACSKVDTFCSGHIVPAGTLTGWARGLCAFEVAKRLGTPTAAQKTAYETANKDIADVRDGKFPNLPKVAGATSGKVASGGKPKVETR